MKKLNLSKKYIKKLNIRTIHGLNCIMYYSCKMGANGLTQAHRSVRERSLKKNKETFFFGQSQLNSTTRNRHRSFHIYGGIFGLDILNKTREGTKDFIILNDNSTSSKSRSIQVDEK